MSSFIGRIFSDKYVNHSAVIDNIVLLLMYRFAYPFSVLLCKLRFSPNQITTLSLIFSILAFIALVFDQGWIWFVLFWGASLLLDFCDGTVARMTNNIGKTAFRYDHNSDLLKINLVILGTGLRYNSELVWMVSFSASFLFMYYTVLNHELNDRRKHKKMNKVTSSSDVNTLVPQNRRRERYRVIAWFVKSDFRLKVYKYSYSAVMTINGHTLLLFLLIPFGEKYATWSFVYLLIIALYGCKARILSLNSMLK